MKNQNKILIIISLIVLITISVQLYWNYIQYENNKQQVENEIQIALDNAVDNYYTELSKKTVFGTFYEYDKDSINQQEVNLPNETVEAIAFAQPDLSSEDPNSINSVESKKNNEFTSITIQEDTMIMGSSMMDYNLDEISQKIQKSSMNALKDIDSINGRKRKIKSITFYQGQKTIDSVSKLNEEVMKIIVSVKYDSIHFDGLTTKLDQELKRKNIDFDYQLVQKSKLNTSMDSLTNIDRNKFPFMTVSNSALLPSYISLEMHFPNIFWITLKKGLMGISLSLILCAAIVYSMFYLLRIIYKQKQLSEIKNDFISNISHELKTPIATVTSAIEGLQNFNSENNPDKTKKYLDISSQQLIKLKILVDKIMETSVIESKELVLDKESTDLVFLLKSTIEKHKFNTTKNIEFESNQISYMMNIDAFHFENAISNLIENAIKYGGNSIKVQFYNSNKETTILVIDNGNGIPYSHKKQIFDKFYRVPTQNKHNIKGYGIGLYYSKNIIEKHNGTIDLESNNPTTFIIRL